LLIQLESPVAALVAIWVVLKPGGSMMMEEAELSAIYAEPHCESYASMRERAIETGRKRGVDSTGESKGSGLGQASLI
jgi:hypothetical protein